MRKILEKDKKIRKKIQKHEKNKFIFKKISTNFNFFNLTRWNSYTNLSNLPVKSSKNLLSNKCIKTIHKKKFNKLTNFSRIVFLRLVKTKSISNIYVSTW